MKCQNRQLLQSAHSVSIRHSNPEFNEAGYSGNKVPDKNRISYKVF